MNIIKKLIQNLKSSSLENDGNKEALITSMVEMAQNKSNPSTKFIISHNPIEHIDLNKKRDNEKSLYLSVANDSHSYIYHCDQFAKLSVVKNDYIQYRSDADLQESSNLEAKFTKLAIERTIKHLENITPTPSLNDDKSLEWLKVSLLTLKKSLSATDWNNALLSYKVFSGAWEESEVFRVIIFNLDIKLTIKSDAVDLVVLNKESNADFDHNSKKYEGQFTQRYNDAFNEIIILLKELAKLN